MGLTNEETQTGATTGEVRNSTEEWKQLPPYRTASGGNGSFEKKWTAHCHCVDCQGLHGAPFQWAAIFHKDDLHFENGAEGLAFYHAPDKSTVHRLPCKVSCAYCHAPIMDEGRNMVLMFPGIIEFSDAEHKKLFDPQCHIFYSQRVIDVHDGKPKWSGLNDKSELINEVERGDANTVPGEPTNENKQE